MKKIIFSILILVFSSWGCNKDTMIDPKIPGNGSTQMPDTSKTVQPAPDTTKIVQPLPETIQIGQQIPDTVNQGTVSALSEFRDIDNNVYHAIKIGKQIWSKENLKTTHYNDGTPIPWAQGTSAWFSMTSGAYCHYKNNELFSKKYGLLYNYYAVTTARLAPKGWHVATFDDWEILMVEIGNRPLSSYISDVGSLVDPADWDGPFYSMYDFEVACTNSTGFTALPNGYRDKAFSVDYPEFDCLGYQAAWWASHKMIYLDQAFGIFSRSDRPTQAGAGIRLVKNSN